MIRKDLQHKTDELVEVAYSLDQYTHDDAEVEDTKAVAKVTEYCDRICSMATAIKEAATLGTVREIEKRLNF